MPDRATLLEQIDGINVLRDTQMMTKEEHYSVEQRLLGELLELLQNDLQGLSHPEPQPKPPLLLSQIYSFEDWITQQKEHVQTVSSLQVRAQKVDHDLGISPPYDETAITNAEEKLVQVEEHWRACAELENLWCGIGREHRYERNISEQELSKEEQEYRTQKKYWDQFQSLKSKYRSVQHPIKPLEYPFDPEDLKRYEEQYDYTIKWSKEIETHKKQLLARYHDQIDFPSIPFSPKEITAYSKKVRPMIRRSRFIRYYIPPIIIVSLIAIYQINSIVVDYLQQSRWDQEMIAYQEQAQTFDCTFSLPEPPYEKSDSPSMGRKLDKCKRLKDEKIRLKKELKTLGWNLAFMQPPYTEDDLKKLKEEQEQLQEVLYVHKQLQDWGLSEDEILIADDNISSVLQHLHEWKAYKTKGLPLWSAREDKLGIKSQKLPTGSFYMGCTQEEESIVTTKGSTRVQIDIPSDFYMMKTEVTENLYDTIMEAENPRDSNLPVSNVTWFDAVKMANALSERVGLTPCYQEDGVWTDAKCTGWRLPTEAEWEYAARGQNGNDRFSGGDSSDRVAWSYKNTDTKQPVATKNPNSWNLYDLSGNVGEWVFDSAEDTDNSLSGQSLYTAEGRSFIIDFYSNKSIIRGGRFKNDGDGTLMSCNRSFRRKTSRIGLDAIGFRLVRNSD